MPEMLKTFDANERVFDIAEDYGFKKKRIAQKNIKLIHELSKHYCEIIKEIKSLNILSDSTHKYLRYDKAREDLHNRLCILLTEKSKFESSSEERDNVSNFAAELSGNNDLIGTFDTPPVEQ